MGGRPKFKSIFKSFLPLQIYIAVIIVINISLDANYCYLNHKSDSSSVLDYLGDWPYYIVIAKLVVIPLFMIIYLPFYCADGKKTLLGK